MDIDNSEVIDDLSGMSLDKDTKKIKSKNKIKLSTLNSININDLSFKELEEYRVVLKKKINKYNDYLEKIDNILNLYV